VPDGKMPGTKTTKRLAVKIDLIGQFYLEVQGPTGSEHSPAIERPANARVALTINEDLAAFFDRNAVADMLLDSYVLALGLTPLAEGNLSWQDKTSVRLLPAAAPLKLLWSLLHPFTPCIDSYYSRRWDARERLWIQSGLHTLPLPGSHNSRQWQTEARLSELSGVLSIALADSKGNKLLTARLDGYGVREDNGIPETILSRN
jgi:hypothetical protein